MKRKTKTLLKEIDEWIDGKNKIITGSEIWPNEQFVNFRRSD